MLEYGDGPRTARQTTRGKLITFDPKFYMFNERSMVTVHMAQIMHTGRQLSHRNISHSVSSVDLFDNSNQKSHSKNQRRNIYCIVHSSFLALSVSRQVT